MHARNLSGALFLLLIFASIPSLAQTSGADSELVSQIRELTAALKQQNKELQACRNEIEQLRGEVGQLRGALQGTASNAQAAAPQSDAELAQKVTALQEDQQLLQSKVNDQYQTKVQSGSRYRVKLSGLLLANFSSNNGAVDDIDVPNLAGSANDYLANASFGGTIRQSEIDLNVDGPSWLGARTSASVAFDFFGGMPQTINGDVLGIARLRTGSARLQWAHTAIEVGQEAPLISPLSPTSFASLATPALGYSGNLWTWAPQITVEHRWDLEGWDYTLQGGLMDPLSGQFIPGHYERIAQPGEASHQPALEARSAFDHVIWGKKMTIGVGGYYSRQSYLLGRNIDGWAGTADWIIPITRRFEISGEAYRGRAIGGLWGADGVSIVSTGSLVQSQPLIRGLNTVGGWAQLKFRATDKLEFNGAFGQDNPFSRDIQGFINPAPYQFVSRNQTTLVNVIDHPRSNLILSLEYRHLNTAWTAVPADTADHINAAMGVIF